MQNTMFYYIEIHIHLSLQLNKIQQTSYILKDSTAINYVSRLDKKDYRTVFFLFSKQQLS